MNGKRILLCCNRSMNIGGIEKALTTLIKTLDTKNDQILLVIHDAKGAFSDELPKENIQLFCTNTVDAKQFLKDDLKHLRLGKLLCGLWNRLMLRLDPDWYARIMYSYRLHERGLKFPGHFDCAIAFSTDYSDLSMIVEADADKRVAFVHGDATYHSRSAKLNDRLIRKLDMVYSVSHEAQEKFVQMHPKYHDELDVIHNVVLEDEIRRKAQEPPTDMLLDGTLSLCTVARLSPEKRQYWIPAIARRLRDDGLNFRWYLVGGGSDRERIEEQIRIHGVAEQVILLGPRSNPYPYIKNCDLYVHTSVHEAYGLAVAEARILCRPIVATNAVGVSEQFHGDDGLVVSQDPDAIYQGVRKLLTNEDLRQSFIQKQTQTEVYVEYDLPKLYEYINS